MTMYFCHRGEVTQINVHFYDDMFLGQHRHAQYDDYYFIGEFQSKLLCLLFLSLGLRQDIG